MHGAFPENGTDHTAGFRIPPGMAKELGQPVAWWDYHDADGACVARVVRFEPKNAEKTYRQCRPDGDHWTWKTKDLQIPLYRLPVLLASPAGTRVYITEGEKHADLLHGWGMTATTNAGGAKKFLPRHAQALVAFDCIILPDNDTAGAEHAALVCHELRALGCTSIRTIALPGLPYKGDIIDWAEAGHTADELELLVARDSQTDAEPEPDAAKAEQQADPEAELLCRSPAAQETSIPRRIYIVPGHIQRGVITEIVGPGGHGKSLLFLTWAVALALGITFGQFIPPRPMRVASLDVEDDLDEQDRRVAAILRMFGKHVADLDDRLLLMNPARTGLLLTLDPDTRKLRRTALMGELLDTIHSFTSDLLMLNPLGELHDAEENDNGALRHVVGELRVIAKQESIGLLFGHHTRKGVPEHGNPDAGRGASSISGVVRKSFTLYEMTPAEATSWKIADHRQFFRLDGAKANYDAKNTTQWFERRPCTLDNLDQVVAPWVWFPPHEVVTEVEISTLIGMVEGGDFGQPWSRRLGKYDRSISRAMEKIGIATRIGQEKALEALFVAATERTFTKPDGKQAMGLRHPSGRPDVRWKE